ncbi:efflux RND transporter periplasmic adaptor subunit [Alloalcanivorax gelatiniphagus]|uniref:Efflux RND transporter periplasmic adaptor subunit n=1 Tax=Alloalcanivorax gelatiniphagus TaxID=1194167 RepID=A0ABY2XPY2_9GAMM|nr:efflux RND transporter periplasmic adaptor subunit [Alloalcanivorax gelatiniphagus]
MRAGWLIGLFTAVLMVAAPAAVRAQTVSGDGDIRGQISAVEHTVLAAPRQGRILEVKARLGERVAKGNALVRFDCRSPQAERDVARARLSAARAQHKVNKDLQAYQNISALEVELSGAEVERAAAELKVAEVRLGDCVVDAPFDGEVVGRNVNPYQWVSAGEPMLELSSVVRFEIEVVVPAAWLTRVKEGSALTFVADATGQTVAAKVARIVDRIDPVSQTVRLIATPTGEAVGVRPGMSGAVRFPASAGADS